MGLSQHRLALALLWLTPAIWSSNYIIARAASGVVSPHTLALGRWLLVFLLLLPFVWTDRASIHAAWKTEWRRMLILGGLGMWVCGAFVYVGAQGTSATNIGLIYAATPVGIALMSKWLLKENSSGAQQASLAMALIGVLVVIGQGNPLNLLFVRFAWGDIWILVAAVSWVTYTVLQQRWPSELSSQSRLLCITLGGLVILFPFTFIEYFLVPPPALSAKAIFLVALAGVLPGFLSYQAYTLMVRELGASKAGVVMYLSPIYAAFTAWWFLNEAPQWFHALGASLILPSVYIATTKRSSHEH